VKPFAGLGGNTFLASFSRCGSFLSVATHVDSHMENNPSADLHELETKTKTQSVFMPSLRAACVAVSPDSKQLVVGESRGRIRLLHTDDFNVQRDLDTGGEVQVRAVLYVAFDPTCRVLAWCCGGRLQLQTL
jgi:hypothetical protein